MPNSMSTEDAKLLHESRRLMYEMAEQYRKSFIDNLKGVEATIASDESLVAVINDVTMSTEARQAALKQLKDTV